MWVDKFSPLLMPINNRWKIVRWSAMGANRIFGNKGRERKFVWTVRKTGGAGVRLCSRIFRRNRFNVPRISPSEVVASFPRLRFRLCPWNNPGFPANSLWKFPVGSLQIFSGLLLVFPLPETLPADWERLRQMRARNDVICLWTSLIFI